MGTKVDASTGKTVTGDAFRPDGPDQRVRVFIFETKRYARVQPADAREYVALGIARIARVEPATEDDAGGLDGPPAPAGPRAQRESQADDDDPPIPASRDPQARLAGAMGAGAAKAKT